MSGGYYDDEVEEVDDDEDMEIMMGMAASASMGSSSSNSSFGEEEEDLGDFYSSGSSSRRLQQRQQQQQQMLQRSSSSSSSSMLLLRHIPYSRWRDEGLDVMMSRMLAVVGKMDMSLASNVQPEAVGNMVIFVKYKYLGYVAPDRMLNWAVALLGEDSNDVSASLSRLDDDTIMERSAVQDEQLRMLMLLLKYNNMADNPSEYISDTEMGRVIVGRAIHVMMDARQLVYYTRRSGEIKQNSGSLDLSRYYEFRQIAPASVDRVHLTEFQSLLQYLIDIIMNRGYLRQGENLWAQEHVLMEAPPAGSGIYSYYGTRAYKKKMTIKEFVCDSAPMNGNHEQWRNLTKSSGNARQAVEYLTTCSSRDVPELVRNRYLHAFDNGVYVVEKHVFVRYEDINSMPAEYDGQHCCSYKKGVYFDEDRLVNSAPDWADWKNIDTPNFDGILRYQYGDDEDTIMWFWGMVVGKLLYNLLEYDQWQVMPFLIGIAGSGKSTIGELICSFYEDCDVAILGNEMEVTFGMQALHPSLNKKLWMIMDAKDTLKLSQGALQSMITGERMQFNRKFETPETHQFTIPGMISANSVPTCFKDTYGALVRRFLFFEFKEAVVETDTTIKAKLKTELPSIMVKGNLAYRHLVSLHGHTDIWQHNRAPASILASRRSFEAMLNPLQAFLSDKTAFDHGCDDDYISYADFQYLVKAFCARNSIPMFPTMWQKGILDRTLSINSLHVKTEEREYMGERLLQVYITCFRLKPGIEIPRK